MAVKTAQRWMWNGERQPIVCASVLFAFDEIDQQTANRLSAALGNLVQLCGVPKITDIDALILEQALGADDAKESVPSND